MKPETVEDRVEHTPGPWDLHGCAVITAFGRGEIANLRSPRDGGVLERNANARLIAAAPDLLKALKETRASLIEQYGPARYAANFPQIDAALTKASVR